MGCGEPGRIRSTGYYSARSSSDSTIAAVFRRRSAILRKCAQELGRGLLWGLPLAVAAPLLALLGNIALMRLPANSQWRLYPYNWQYVTGLLFAVVGVYGTVFLHALTGEAREAEGAECNGLYGWLTGVFVADIVLCVLAAGLGVWYTVRMFRS